MWEIKTSYWIGTVATTLVSLGLLSTEMMGGVNLFTIFLLVLWTAFLIYFLVVTLSSPPDIKSPAHFFRQHRHILALVYVLLVIVTIVTTMAINTDLSGMRPHLVQGALTSFLALQLPMITLFSFDYLAYTRPEKPCPGPVKCYQPCHPDFCPLGPVCLRRSLSQGCPQIPSSAPATAKKGSQSKKMPPLPSVNEINPNTLAY